MTPTAGGQSAPMTLIISQTGGVSGLSLTLVNNVVTVETITGTLSNSGTLNLTIVTPGHATKTVTGTLGIANEHITGVATDQSSTNYNVSLQAID